MHRTTAGDVHDVLGQMSDLGAAITLPRCTYESSFDGLVHGYLSYPGTRQTQFTYCGQMLVNAPLLDAAHRTLTCLRCLAEGAR